MKLVHLQNEIPPEIVALWEDNMQEPFSDYELADKFIQLDENDNIVASFAVYYDESDGVCGNFVSGWSERKNPHVCEILQMVADYLGEVYVKTDKRQVKIILHKLGKMVKNTDRFVYFIIKRK